MRFGADAPTPERALFAVWSIQRPDGKHWCRHTELLSELVARSWCVDANRRAARHSTGLVFNVFHRDESPAPWDHAPGLLEGIGMQQNPPAHVTTRKGTGWWFRVTYRTPQYPDTAVRPIELPGGLNDAGLVVEAVRAISKIDAVGMAEIEILDITRTVPPQQPRPLG